MIRGGEENVGKEKGCGGGGRWKRGKKEGNGGGTVEGIGGALGNDVKKLGQGWKKMVERTRRKGLLKGEMESNDVNY